jgi:hypothetical protein
MVGGSRLIKHGRVARQSRTREGKQFFFEKRTKKLLDLGPSPSGEAEARYVKVFCFFFSKKKTLLS